VAITSSFYPDPTTHVEPVRYGRGSNSMGLLETMLVDGGPGGPRWWKLLREVAAHPVDLARMLSVRHWSERTIIVLVMQALDNSLRVVPRRTLFGQRLSTRPGHGPANPRWLPQGHEVARRLAQRIDGMPGGSWADIANIPMTAHIIGGCPIGDSPATGVVDPYQRLYGHRGLHVVDGAAVPANLGVNPSLTITALAERALSFWPNRGEPDSRPPLGHEYRPVPPAPPHRPAVPEGAPGALRLT
jgi:cholesterol oxidase